MKKMKKSFLMLAVLAIFVLIPVSVSARAIKSSDIQMWNKSYSPNYIEIKIKNPTKSRMIIDRWLGAYNSRSKKWEGVMSTCYKTKKQAAYAIIAPGKTAIVRFIVPNRVYTYPFAFADRAYINFKLGSKWWHLLITPKSKDYYDLADGRTGKYRISIWSGKIKIPYQKFLVVYYSQFKAVKNGMTYAQVCKLFGFNGTLDGSGNGYSYYEWEGVNEYSSVWIMFENGRVTYKSQVNLK